MLIHTGQLKTNVVTLVILSLILISSSITAAYAQEQEPKDYPPITDYFSPCPAGTHAEVFTWHGINQDGLPPVDLDRRSTDFLCVNKEVFAPYGGTVYGTTGRWGGLILIDDPAHDACMIFLGMLTFEVGQDEIVNQGDLLGIYNWHVHIAVTDGNCAAANWYDWDARSLERPVSWIELGQTLPSDILERDAWPFEAQNPAGQSEDN
jgi:hypothetical protein